MYYYYYYAFHLIKALTRIHDWLIFFIRSELKNLDPFLMLDHFSGMYIHTYIQLCLCETLLVEAYFGWPPFVLFLFLTSLTLQYLPQQDFRIIHTEVFNSYFPRFAVGNFVYYYSVSLYFDFLLVFRFWNRHLHARGTRGYI